MNRVTITLEDSPDGGLSVETSFSGGNGVNTPATVLGNDLESRLLDISQRIAENRVTYFQSPFGQFQVDEYDIDLYPDQEFVELNYEYRGLSFTLPATVEV